MIYSVASPARTASLHDALTSLRSPATLRRRLPQIPSTMTVVASQAPSKPDMVLITAASSAPSYTDRCEIQDVEVVKRIALGVIYIPKCFRLLCNAKYI